MCALKITHNIQLPHQVFDMFKNIHLIDLNNHQNELLVEFAK